MPSCLCVSTSLSLVWFNKNKTQDCRSWSTLKTKTRVLANVSWLPLCPCVSVSESLSFHFVCCYVSVTSILVTVCLFLGDPHILSLPLSLWQRQHLKNGDIETQSESICISGFMSHWLPAPSLYVYMPPCLFSILKSLYFHMSLSLPIHICVLIAVSVCDLVTLSGVVYVYVYCCVMWSFVHSFLSFSNIC